VLDRYAGAGQVLEILGVVLMAEDMHRTAAFERGPDPVRPGELLGITEARREEHLVQMPAQLGVGGQPLEHHAGPVGEDDADRLPVEILVQLLHHRFRAAGQGKVQIGVRHIGHGDPIGRQVPSPRPHPGRQDRRPDVLRPDRIEGEEVQPRRGGTPPVVRRRCEFVHGAS
jgi:hypothetical protein